jgi:general secretion pathway protein N
VRWGASALGLATFAAALLATLAALAPATLIDSQLARVTDGRLRLAGAQGTLWSGTGWIEVRDPAGRAGVARHIAWRVLPESLLRARLMAEVELDQGAKPFPFAVSLSRVEIADAGITLPAAALALGVPKLAPLRLTGEIRVSILQLSLERGRLDGDATLLWRAAGSALTPVSPLGEYELHLKAAGPAVHATLRTLEGPLQLDGEGSWSGRGSPGFLATARVPEPQQEQLSPLLRLIAVERGTGLFELRSP